MGHLLAESRHILVVDACLTEANGTAERAALLDIAAEQVPAGATIGGDKNNDTAPFPMSRRTPPTGARPSTAAPRASSGYAVSQHKHKRIEEPFGWIKTTAGLRKTRHRGRRLVERFFVLTTAYELIRMSKLRAVAWVHRRAKNGPSTSRIYRLDTGR